MALQAATRIGAYEIPGPLGPRGMSEVCRARDLTLGREVALKLLPQDWSRDRTRVARFDIHVFSLGTGRTRPLAATRFEEAGGAVSPDGCFFAHVSTETGREQVCLRRLPGAQGRWRISSDSGSEPVWSRDGTTLFFRSSSSLLAVDVRTGQDFEASKPRVLFDAVSTPRARSTPTTMPHRTGETSL